MAFLVDDKLATSHDSHGQSMSQHGGVARAGRSRGMLLRPYSEFEGVAVQTGMPTITSLNSCASSSWFVLIDGVCVVA